MTSVSAKRFNWIRSPAQREKNQAWRERQQEARDNFEAANTSANSSFFGAGINMATGSARSRQPWQGSGCRRRPSRPCSTSWHDADRRRRGPAACVG